MIKVYENKSVSKTVRFLHEKKFSLDDVTITLQNLL